MARVGIQLTKKTDTVDADGVRPRLVQAGYTSAGESGDVFFSYDTAKITTLNHLREVCTQIELWGRASGLK